jgi:predicted AlkP superfamily pyrophosphatase or phosphodiesterase
VLLVLLVLGAVPAAAEKPTVIVLSWDGLRHDYPDRASLPALGRMEAEGLRASRLVPVFPSNTFPNHVSLATGTYTDRHGIVNNVFREPGRGLYRYSKDASWLQAEPLWVAAERQGVRAATFFWVGSETDWNGTGATYRKTPFDAGVDEAVKVDQILAWLDLPEVARPGLVMAWWHGADSVGHRKGPEHPDIADQLLAQDAQLVRLLAGLDERKLWDRTTLLVVSDHGMTEVGEKVEVRDRLEAAGIGAEVIPGSATARVYLEDPGDLEAARTVLEAIPEVEVHPGDGLPAALRASHPTRNGDLILVTDPPRTFVKTGWLRAAAVHVGASFLDYRPGSHGYRPDHPDMSGAFLAIGRGVARGARVASLHVTDIAPTVARLLGIDPPALSEGTPIAAITPP